MAVPVTVARCPTATRDAIGREEDNARHEVTQWERLMTTEAPAVQTFQALGNYVPPSLPTADTLQIWVDRFHHVFSKNEEQPFIADDRLQRSTRSMLDDVAAPPACGPVLEELQATLADWIDNPCPTGRLKLIVLPPGDENGVVEAWARRHGHTLLPAPDRDALITERPVDLPDLDGDGVLVIAQLECWFMRHRNGLSWIRALLARLDTLQRSCVIGCNSWAWALLSRIVGANLVLPDGLTFKPFDAQRLRRWFSELATEDALDNVRFRLSSSGEDVMATDEDGELKQDYFKRVAARSMGIPWVAWQLWRRSLRSDIDPSESTLTIESDEEDAQTLWVTALQEFSLPGEPSELALLVLQALLIHGTLSMHELRLVLPLAGKTNIISSLIKAGIVQRKDGRMRCVAAAYPAIRKGLATAGLPLDRL